MSNGMAFTAALAVSLVVATADSSRSQTWPNRAVSVVVPFTAGTTVDITARVVMEQVSKQTGSAMVIENRGGAGGTIATGQVAKAAPDGSTLLSTGNLGSAYALYANLPYDPLRDFTGIILLGYQPLVLVTGPTTPHKTLADLVAAGKAKPGALNYVSAGIGTVTHLAAERLRLSAGFEAQHVPFRGANEALTEIMSGRVDFYVAPLPSALQLIKDGKVRALAVCAENRVSHLPDKPTTTELGLKDSAYTGFTGLFAPAKTPREVVLKIHAETAKALATPAIQDRMRSLGLENSPTTQPQFDKYFRDDVDANVALVKAAKIPVQR